MLFEDILKKNFGNVYTETDFIEKTTAVLNRLGFSADNSIACASICRDEISQSFLEAVNKKWGYAFNLSSLAGMFSAGRTGLMAAMHHSPIVDGKERYVFYALPHIAIDAEGRAGVCSRRGREGASSACGALVAFQNELKTQKSAGSRQREIDSSDAEYSLIKLRLSKEVPATQIPDLLELTRIAQKVILQDLEHSLETVIDKAKSDYAMMSGIQIHGPDKNYVYPVSCYVVTNGIKKEFTLEK